MSSNRIDQVRHQEHTPCPDVCHEQRPSNRSSWLLDETQRNSNALATRFVDRFGDDLLYVPKWRKWLIWDGKRFRIDEGGALVLRRGREFADSLWTDFQAVAKDKSVSRDESSSARQFCKYANGDKGIREFINLAKADSRVLIDHDTLNGDQSLLNLRNGTYDMERGEFREHRRSDRITQLANVNYCESADCPLWKAAINLIFNGDKELIRFVQQVLGYSLAGDSGEHMLPIAYGSGCNGKSFVWNAIVELAGEYGGLANESLLLGIRNTHPTEKAVLYQKRIVAISEPEQGSTMRESRVKELTGDSVITARRMREDFWTFSRTHTFWLSTNHLPRVTGTDFGIWRRLKVIPFAVDLRDKLKPIPDYHQVVLESEGPGILNWLLEGHRDYRVNGFVEPDAVTKLGQKYKDEQDHLGAFIRECCVVGPDLRVAGKELFGAYKAWGGSDYTNTAFGREMGQRYVKDKPRSGPFRDRVVYKGIALAQSEPMELGLVGDG